MAAPAHPDLSQAFASPLNSVSSSKPPIPRTPLELLKVIRSCKTNRQIQDTLIPLLDRIASGESQSGSTKKQKMKNGEKLLRLEGIVKDFDLTKLKDAEVKAMTAALVYILSARFDSPPDAMWEQLMMVWMMKFVKQLDPEQIRMTRSRLGSLAWSFHRLCKKSGKPELCIPIILGIQSFAYPPSVFTGVFPAILESCIMAKEYDFAFALINEIPKDFSTAVPSYLDILTYFHHAGLIFAATGQYARAKESFVLALCLPTAAASAIQLACAKRAILCELIDSGKLVRYPKYMPGPVSRIIDRNAETYTKLAKAFEAHDWAVVQAAEKTEVFEQDCNLGLVQILIGSIMKRKILRVKATFSRLRLDQLAEKVGEASGQSANTAATLQTMIAKGEVNATISPADPSPIITFLEEVAPPPGVTARQLAEAEAQEAWLEASLIRGSKAMGMTETYLNKQLDMSEVSGTSKKPRGIDEREIKTRGGVRGVGRNLNDMGF